MARTIIQTHEVEVVYNNGRANAFKALRNVNVEIMAREYVIFFGPSGCGKSTLLYTIFGILPPSRGRVYVKGDSIYDYSAKRLVAFQRHTMGIMYQQFNLIPSLTVLDNVALPLIFSGVPPSKRERRAMELLDRFHIAHVADQFPTNLSGGQQQRVSVARSLVHNPEILIADEPVGNLDSVSAETVMSTLETINKEDKKTILLVTHDAKHLPYAHRVFYLKDGRIDRIVANPEKKQILKLKPGASIATELEQVQHIYPYDSPRMVRVKSLMNYLTQRVSFDQLLRLEKITEYAIEGRLSYGTFLSLLQKLPAEGGVGLREADALYLAQKLYRVLEHAQDIVRFRALRNHTPPPRSKLEEITDRLATHLIQEYEVALSTNQHKHLRRSIEVRVSGFIEKEEFKRQLQLPVANGGVGLDVYTAHDLARYLEKLIAQGVAELKELARQGHNAPVQKHARALAAEESGSSPREGT